LDLFWAYLLVKVVSTAIVVVAATYIAERSGPFWGALFAAFPVSAGPAYAMLALEAEADFVAASALNSFASMSAGAPFVVALVTLATRTSAFIALGGALVVWTLFAIPIGLVEFTFLPAAAMNLAVLMLCFRLTRAALSLEVPVLVVKRRWFDLPLRSLVVGCFVAAVVTASEAMGPVGTGFAATFPITFSSLAVVLHLRHGGVITAVTMASALRAVLGMYFALPVLHFTVLSRGVGWGLSLALATAMIWALILVLHRRRTRKSHQLKQSLPI